jgi:hypothetical protein
MEPDTSTSQQNQINPTFLDKQSPSGKNTHFDYKFINFVSCIVFIVFINIISTINFYVPPSNFMKSTEELPIRISSAILYSCFIFMFTLVNYFLQERILSSAGIFKKNPSTSDFSITFEGFILLFIATISSFLYFFINWENLNYINYFSAYLIIFSYFITPFVITFFKIRPKTTKSILLSTMYMLPIVISYLIIFLFYMPVLSGDGADALVYEIIISPIVIGIIILSLLISTPLFIKSLKYSFSLSKD